MGNFTKELNLYIPYVEEYFNIYQFNQNNEKIDTYAGNTNYILEYQSKEIEKLKNISIKYYDKIIDTQEKFNNMLQSQTWEDSQNIIIIGNFEANYNLSMPENVKSIIGYGNSSITSNTGVKTLKYKTTKPMNTILFTEGIKNLKLINISLYKLKNITNINMITYSGGGSFNLIDSCENISNVYATLNGGIYTGNFLVGLNRCKNIYNVSCHTVASGAGAFSIPFYYCENLSNCYAWGDKVEGSSVSGYAFYMISYANLLRKLDGENSATSFFYGATTKVDLTTCDS